MPYLWGAKAKQEELIEGLADVFRLVSLEHNLSDGDMPPLVEFQENLKAFNFYSFPTLDKRLIQDLQRVIAKDIPKMLRRISGVVRRNSSLGESEQGDTEVVNGSLWRSWNLEGNRAFQILLVLVVVPLLVAILTVLTFFFWDEIVSLIPASAPSSDL